MSSPAFPTASRWWGRSPAATPGGLRALVDRLGVSRAALVAPDPDADIPTGWGVGLEAACEIAALPADVVCVAITGAAALRPTLAALDAGTTVATATKEVLVMAGEVVRARSLAVGCPHRPHRQRALGTLAVPAGRGPGERQPADPDRQRRAPSASATRRASPPSPPRRPSATRPGTWGPRSPSTAPP